MKKLNNFINILFVVIISIVVSSCSDDDANDILERTTWEGISVCEHEEQHDNVIWIFKFISDSEVEIILSDIKSNEDFDGTMKANYTYNHPNIHIKSTNALIGNPAYPLEFKGRISGPNMQLEEVNIKLKFNCKKVIMN